MSTTGASIVVCGADSAAHRELAQALRDEGYVVHAGRSAVDALALIASQSPLVGLLDVDLPDGDGCAVCRTLRARGSVVPLMLLSDHRELASRLAGFDAGCDGYMIRPFALAELVARVHALARRAAARR